MGPRLLRYWIRLARNPKSWRRAIYGLVKIRYVKIALQPILDRVANRPRPEETKAEPIEILSEIRSLVRRGTRFLRHVTAG
jgi:hypothetical protein